MVIGTEGTLALFCPHCGKLQTHTLNRFSLLGQPCQELICACGSKQAVVHLCNDRHLLLELPCLLCGETHSIRLDARYFWKAKLERIYCQGKNLELGMYGKREWIEEAESKQQQELQRLVEEDYSEESVENPQAMIEIFNQVHDLAVRGHISCPCGQTLLDAQIYPDAIELSCRHCGGRQLIPACREEHVAAIRLWRRLHLELPRQTGHNH